MIPRFDDDFELPTPDQAAKVWAAVLSGDLAKTRERLIKADICPSNAEAMLTAAAEIKRTKAITTSGEGLSEKLGKAKLELEILRRSQVPAGDVAAHIDAESACQQKIGELTAASEEARIASVHLNGITQRYWLFINPTHERKLMPAADGIPQVLRDELKKLRVADDDQAPWMHVAPILEGILRPRKTTSAADNFTGAFAEQ